MTTLTLLILTTVTWVLWAIGGMLALRADKLETKCAIEAGFSIVPIRPRYPILAVLFAIGIDRHCTPWGTRIIAGIHILLGLAFVGGILRKLSRVHRAQR